MNIEKLLKEKFEDINKAFFEKEAGHKFLRIEVNFRNLEKITELSKEISTFLDSNDPVDYDYFLDIYSPGTDEELDKNNLKEYVEENVYIKLKKNINDKNDFIGQIIEASEIKIVLKWNAKGQFRKQEINIDNIELVKKYAKI